MVLPDSQFKKSGLLNWVPKRETRLVGLSSESQGFDDAPVTCHIVAFDIV